MANRRGSKTKVGQDKSDLVTAIPRACSDEVAAVEFMEKQRWGNSPACPRCGDTDINQMMDRKTGERNKRFLWRCHGCKQQFTVRIGTVFEESRIPLRHWCYAFWAACASKKGVSALQIKRQTGLSYKSALFLMHRIRFAMAPANQQDGGKLDGTVEVDECYVGGRGRYKGHRKPGRPTAKEKTPVLAMVERGGRVRARAIPNVTAATLKETLHELVNLSAHVVTDEYNVYPRVVREFWGGHDTVCHSAKEYVRGDVHTNTVEGFFSILKRGLNGTFHAVSKKHLHRYLSEFEFRYNTRWSEDGERTMLAIQAADGKRLTYRQQTAH
jgi:transposase-like protein